MFQKTAAVALFLLLGIALSASGLHKFYVSINQINYVAPKKELQITSRFFIDDITKALEKKHKTLFYLGTERETAEMKKNLYAYYLDNFSLKVNHKSAPIQLVTSEMEEDVIVFYAVSKNIGKISSLEVKNTLLFEVLPEQQNIIHSTLLGNKKSVLLTVNKSADVLK